MDNVYCADLKECSMQGLPCMKSIAKTEIFKKKKKRQYLLGYSF